MKARIGPCLAALLLASSVCRADEAKASADFHVAVGFISPSDSEDWDAGTGVELQLRFWQSRRFALVAALGMESWDAVHEFVEDGDDSFYSLTDIDGSVTVLPVGLSLLFRSDPDKDISLTCAAGVRYAFVSSDVTAYTYYEDALGPLEVSDVIEIDNTVLAVVDLGLEFPVEQGISLSATARFQKDLLEPDETYQGDSIGSTRLDAFSFLMGFSWQF
jgi:hypothetical protein